MTSFTRRTEDYPLYVRQGDVFRLGFRLRPLGNDGVIGDLLTLTGPAVMQIRPFPASPTVLATATCTIPDQTGAERGVVWVELSAIQTAALPATGGVWDLEIPGQGTVIGGRVHVQEQVSR